MTLKPGSTGSEYVYETLGEIKATLLSVSRQMDGLANTISRTGDNLSGELQDLRDDVAGVARRVDKLEADYASVRGSMDIMAPKVESLIDQRNRIASWTMGATAVLGVAWWALGGYVIDGAKALVKAFTSH
jgi:hypothetical protein